MDGLDKFTGGAGNDSFTANNAALGTLDSIDGGAGTDTLTITDSVSIPSRVITAAGIETLSVTSTAGSVGQVAVGSTIAAKQKITFDVTKISTASAGNLILNVGGVTKAIAIDATTKTGDATFATAMGTQIEAVLDAAYGTATGGSTYVTYPTATTVQVESATAGVALPSIAFVQDTAGKITYATGYKPTASQQANQVTADAVAASTFSVPTDVTTATISAATSAKVASVSTAATTVTGTDVTLSGGASQTITATGSVYASGTKGAVVINNSANGDTTSAGFYVATSSSTGLKGGWGSTADVTASGVLVTGGSTVSVTNAAAGISSSSIATTVNTSTTQVGSDWNRGVSASNAATGKETILNSALSPTGDVSVTTANDFTNAAASGGVKDVALGGGATKIYMNGGTTASVKGANSVTITDLGTATLAPDAASPRVTGTSKLTTVNLDGLNGTTPTASITSDALTNLKVINSSGTVTVTNTTVGHALNLTVGNSGVTGTPLVVSDAAATSVAVASEASAYGYVNGSEINAASASVLKLTTPLATALTFTNGQAVTLEEGTAAAGNVDKVKSITASGTGKLTIVGTDTTTWAKLTSIDASTASGAVTATITANQSFKGGSGNDTVKIAAVPNYTVDGGTGTNKIVITNAAALTGLATSVTNFQTLGLGAALSATAGAYTSFSVESDNTSTVTGATGSAVTVANAKYTGNLTLTGLVNDKIALTVNVGTSGTGLKGTGAFPAALTLLSTTADTTTGHTTNGIESITINSSGKTNAQEAADPTGAVSSNTDNTFTYAAADALKTVVITGGSDIVVSTGGAVASIDASTSTGDVDVTAVTLKTSGATIKGGTGALTATGSAGVDTITAGLAGGTINGSAGGDTITLPASQTAQTVLAYAASTSTISAYDLISGFQNYTGTTGSTSDKIDFAGTNTILADQATTAATGATGISYTSKSGLITFLTTAGAASTITSPVALLSAVSALNGTTANQTSAFEIGGNTYVINSATTAAGDDIVVELVGVTGLTSLAGTAGPLVLLVG